MGIIGDIGAILVGLLLLFAGRRFFWLAAGLIGFLFGFNIFQNLFGLWWLNLVVGGILGLILGWLAVKFIKVVSFFVGFLAGAVLLPYLLGFFGIEHNWLLMGLIGGIIGAVLIGFAFEWGLILVTALLGASMVSHNLADVFDLNQTVKSIIGLVLVLLGIVIQSNSKGKRG